MKVFNTNLIETKRLARNKSTVWEKTDGCEKQYICAALIYLMKILASTTQLVIYRTIVTPGHGKDVVDGLNARDKRYLRDNMNK